MVAIVVVLWLMFSPKPAKVMVATDRNDYRTGDSLEVSFKNELDKQVCFSACYPYYVEKKDGVGIWTPYSYDGCQESDAASGCIAAKSGKKFVLTLDEIKPGLNRLKIPVCIGCSDGQAFKSDSVIYSNNFEIK